MDFAVKLQNDDKIMWNTAFKSNDGSLMWCCPSCKTGSVRVPVSVEGITDQGPFYLMSEKRAMPHLIAVPVFKFTETNFACRIEKSQLDRCSP
jgi:hypothetical protein